MVYDCFRKYPSEEKKKMKIFINKADKTVKNHGSSVLVELIFMPH